MPGVHEGKDRLTYYIACVAKLIADIPLIESHATSLFGRRCNNYLSVLQVKSIGHAMVDFSKSSNKRAKYCFRDQLGNSLAFGGLMRSCCACTYNKYIFD